MSHSVTLVGGPFDGEVITTDMPAIEAVHDVEGEFKIATYLVNAARDTAHYSGSRGFYDHPDSNG